MEEQLERKLVFLSEFRAEWLRDMRWSIGLLGFMLLTARFYGAGGGSQTVFFAGLILLSLSVYMCTLAINWCDREKQKIYFEQAFPGHSSSYSHRGDFSRKILGSDEELQRDYIVDRTMRYITGWGGRRVTGGEQIMTLIEDLSGVRDRKTFCLFMGGSASIFYFVESVLDFLAVSDEGKQALSESRVSLELFGVLI